MGDSVAASAGAAVAASAGARVPYSSGSGSGGCSAGFVPGGASAGGAARSSVGSGVPAFTCLSPVVVSRSVPAEVVREIVDRGMAVYRQRDVTIIEWLGSSWVEVRGRAESVREFLSRFVGVSVGAVVPVPSAGTSVGSSAGVSGVSSGLTGSVGVGLRKVDVSAYADVPGWYAGRFGTVVGGSVRYWSASAVPGASVSAPVPRLGVGVSPRVGVGGSCASCSAPVPGRGAGACAGSGSVGPAGAALGAGGVRSASLAVGSWSGSACAGGSRGVGSSAGVTSRDVGASSGVRSVVGGMVVSVTMNDERRLRSGSVFGLGAGSRRMVSVGVGPR